MAQRTVQGKIARVSSKPFKDNRTQEDITLYSFQLEGTNEWYRTGQNPIPAGVGQDVKFVATGANVEKGTLVCTQPAVAHAPSTSAASAAPTAATSAAGQATRAPASSTAGSKDGYWDAKERRDLEKDARFQAVNEPRMALSVAVSAAAELVSTAITKDAISFGNAAKAKKLGMLAAYTKEVALELAAFITDAPHQLATYRPVSVGTSSDKADDSSEVQE